MNSGRTGLGPGDLALDPVPLRPRDDGWTPARQRAFLEALASCGSVAAAARRVGMSRESAYALRRRADARGFAQAWDAARLLAAEHLVDLAWDRATQGEVRPLVYHGEVVGEVRHYDNRLLLGLIAQNRKALVEQGLVDPPEVTAAVAADWDAALSRAERGEALAVPAPGEERTVLRCFDELSTQDERDFEGGEDLAGLPAPLPPQTDGQGGVIDEAGQLEVGAYDIWWQADRDCWLTSWPAPQGWTGEEFRIDRYGDVEPWPEDEDEAHDAGGPREGWARTLTPEEVAGAERQAAETEVQAAARLELYRRRAFDLASAAELASLDRAEEAARIFAP